MKKNKREYWKKWLGEYPEKIGNTNSNMCLNCSSINFFRFNPD